MNVALTIAGSDSGGGAGIQADLKTFHQFGVYGTSVVTAITAQNTRGVSRLFPVPVELLEAQLAAVAEDLRPGATKSGMLATRELVDAVAEGLARHRLVTYVLDPVMVASSGDRLLDRDAERALRERLVPRATVVTPNLDEARILVEQDVRTPEEMEAAGQALVRMGAQAALVKGGHLSGTEIVDILVRPGGARPFRHAKIDTTSTHGTGCTLSAGIVAGLARGASLDQAAAAALDFVHRAIQWAPRLGTGHGPLNHFVDAPE
jgi:hydroxymethylpyrimidine kinase/phosphomethylpyrimidine kinase